MLLHCIPRLLRMNPAVRRGFDNRLSTPGFRSDWAQARVYGANEGRGVSPRPPLVRQPHHGGLLQCNANTPRLLAFRRCLLYNSCLVLFDTLEMKTIPFSIGGQSGQGN